MNVAQAQNADSNSGDNYVPEKSTTIRQQADSRWVIYDRGDQTDWLRVTPTNDETLQSVTRLNFTRVEGRVLLEVYGDDPYGEVLEHKIFTEAQEYSYVSSSLSTRYFKLYAESSGSLAKYEFSYELHPVPSPTPAATPEVVPTSKPGPESTATAMPTETPTATPSPIPTATATPTELPTAPPSPAPTATSTPTATPSPIPTATATPTELPTATQSPTPTATFTPTTTPTETPTTTPSPAPTATATPTAAPTATPTKTLSPEPTAPLTATAIPTVTLGPAPTATATPTATPTITPAASAVSTSTPDLPTTATATPLPSATPTETASPMPTPVVSSISSEDGSDVDSSPTSASTPQTLNLALLIAVIICLIVIVTLSILLLLARKRLARLDKPVTDMLRASDYKQLGQFAAEQGKTHLAERCYRKMVAQEPYNWNIRYELGIFFFQTERYSEAIKELSLYLKSDIIDSAVYGYLAYAYLATENWAKAEEWYKKALEVKPEDPYAYFGLGVIAQSRAQYAQADQLYHQSLELDPGLEEARENLRQIQPYL